MNTNKRIFQFILPFWKLIAAAILVSIAFAFLNGFAMWMSATFVQTVFDQGEDIQEVHTEIPQDTLNLNDYLKRKTQDLVTRDTKTGTLKMVCLVILVAFLLKNLAEYERNILIARVNNHTMNNIRNRLYEHLQKLSMRYF